MYISYCWFIHFHGIELSQTPNIYSLVGQIFTNTDIHSFGLTVFFFWCGKNVNKTTIKVYSPFFRLPDWKGMTTISITTLGHTEYSNRKMQQQHTLRPTQTLLNVLMVIIESWGEAGKWITHLKSYVHRKAKVTPWSNVWIKWNYLKLFVKI